MDDTRPLLMTTEHHQKMPLLIIDKHGYVGESLALKLKDEFLVVLVSGKAFEVDQNIIHIPYHKKIPLIPDNPYSHMFIIYNGEQELLDLLPVFVAKADSVQSKLFFILSLEQLKQSVYGTLTKHTNQQIRLIVYGEIFDDALSEQNGLTYLIKQARASGKIVVPNNGMSRIFPVLFDDVLLATIAFAFAPDRQKKLIYLFPKHEIHEVYAARLMQKINPLLHIDYKKQRISHPKYYIPTEGEYFFQNYSLEERLRLINLQFKKSDLKPAALKTVVPPVDHKYPHPLLISSLLVLGLVIVPLLYAAGATAVGAGFLQLSLKQAQTFHIEMAKKEAGIAKSSFNSASAVFSTISYLDVVTGDHISGFAQQANNGARLAGIEEDLLDAGKRIQNVLQQQSVNPQEDFLQAIATIKYSLITIQKMEAEDQLPDTVKIKLKSLDEGLALIENMSDAIPALFGFSGPKQYLVLFQNNMELRPGGGFIGSYGILKINQGKIDPLKVYDVYDADGKLATHVEPPYALRRYLGAPHLFLRDSNFDPDFEHDAMQALQFLQLEMHQNADGVIAIDTTFLQKLIGAVGPVYVQDYKETVTADNFYILTQNHAEKDFFPGSTQKKDFLRALFNALMTKLSDDKQLAYAKIIDSALSSIKEKHFMIADENQSLQKIFTVNNLSGSLWDGRVNDTNTFFDYLGIVDANLGMNKSNYYLKRSVEQRAVISEHGDITTTANVTYENTSAKDSPYGGDYKNYVRFILPANAVVQSVLIDGQQIPTIPAILDTSVFTQKDFVPPNQLELEEVDTEDKHLVGFFVIVPAGSKKTVSLTYIIPQALDLQKPSFIYDAYIFKQPGTINDPYNVYITYPASYQPLTIQGSAVDLGGKISFDTQLDTDKAVVIHFTKK